MMSKAEGLLKSDKLEDQIEGQKLMSQAQRLFEMISKLIDTQSQLQSKAISAIR